jgi:two-component system cell cycle sensor histidine kinase/response regulator CckA
MPRALVVDDDPAIRSALRKLLRVAGIEVVEAASAIDAFDVLAADDGIDAMVCDVVMPGIDGVAFYDAVLNTTPGLRSRIVFLTGAADDPGVHRSIEQRGAPLVSKLSDLQIVVDAVRLALLRTP